MVTAGLSCPPEMCRTDIARVAMLNPWLKAMCITEGGVLFHCNTVPHTMNKNKRVAKNSAKTSVQNDRERNSILPSRRNIFASISVSYMNRNENGTYCRLLKVQAMFTRKSTGFQGLPTPEKDFQSHTFWLAKYLSSFISHLMRMTDLGLRLSVMVGLKVEGGQAEGAMREGRCL